MTTTAHESPDDVLTLRQAAKDWMAKNPTAMDYYRRFAKQMMARRKRFGIKLLTERVRWECAFAFDDGEDFKITNTYTAYIARQLVFEMPELAEWIVCKVTRAADLPVKRPRIDPPLDPLSEAQK